MGKFVKPFEDMTRRDFQEAGGKGANLCEMLKAGFPVPPGFCVCSNALDHVIETNRLRPRIDEISAHFDYEDFGDVERKTAEIRALIESAPIPADLEAELKQAIPVLLSGNDASVAIRSSVAVRGTAIGSFPGMMDTYHYIKGDAEILRHIRMCWASLWTERAVHNRHHKGIDHRDGLIAPVVQRMVNSEVAGVLFTANPITGSRDEIAVESNWGLGESVVSGKSMNDFFVVDKATLEVKIRRIARKTLMVTLDQENRIGRKEYPVPQDMVSQATLSDRELEELGRTGLKIEELFRYPQDIEWAYEKGKLFILQSRNIKTLKD